MEVEIDMKPIQDHDPNVFIGWFAHFLPLESCMDELKCRPFFLYHMPLSNRANVRVSIETKLVLKVDYLKAKNKKNQYRVSQE